jgi:metal-responsive CopG/Arc/MetJ family transcriptional regulator
MNHIWKIVYTTHSNNDFEITVFSGTEREANKLYDKLKQLKHVTKINKPVEVIGNNNI